MKSKKVRAIVFAILAALLYALNTPFSKIFLQYVSETVMAGLLYIGAGIGMGILFLLKSKKEERSSLLAKEDLPYTIGMIVLDILAPICLMYGLKSTSSANVSLLNNFEIVATSLIALILFKEAISKGLWLAIFFITVSSIVLTREGISGLEFSWGSIFVLLATMLWGLENNCTRKLSDKNVYQIVTIKGIFSGLGALMIGFLIGEKLPQAKIFLLVLVLGFVAYGLSIYFYIRSQKELGAAKTSAYYALAPFMGAFLSFVILKEGFSAQFFLAFILMALGSLIVTLDTILLKHSHVHSHVIVHGNNGMIETLTISHEHAHSHFMEEERHKHRHLM